jgi:1-acyl-sn-glycerol-3-phosphate acyltransferase
MAIDLRQLISTVRRNDIVGLWAGALERELQNPEDQRDPEFIKRLVPLMELFGRYFGAEVRHFDRVPRQGAVLLIGNHSGGMLTPDTSVLMAAWYRARGTHDPLALLAADPVFGIPGFKILCRKLGLVPASHGNAERALQRGASLLLYPGGAYEVYRPWAERNRVEFGGHKGFIKLALRAGVPVVPVVGHGGHESVVVLSRGETLARIFGMNRIRLDIFPIIAQVPWGISSPVLPGIPLPSKVVVEVCEPLHWSAYGPEAANDPQVIDRCYEEITALMQVTLSRLADEHPRPLAARLGELLPGPHRRLS